MFITYFKISFHFTGRNLGNNKNKHQDSWCPGWDSKQILPEWKFNESPLEKGHWSHICIFFNKNSAHSQTQGSVFMSSWLITFQFYENGTNRVLLHHDERVLKKYNCYNIKSSTQILLVSIFHVYRMRALNRLIIYNTAFLQIQVTTAPSRYCCSYYCIEVYTAI